MGLLNDWQHSRAKIIFMMHQVLKHGRLQNSLFRMGKPKGPFK
jgi:hypothetical protein